MTKTGRAMVVAVALLSTGAGAQDLSEIGDVRSGRKLAVQDCRPCHHIGPGSQGPQPHAGPPSFYAIANMASTTPTSLYVFLHTPHPTMPNLRLDKKEADDVIAYILSLRRQTP